MRNTSKILFSILAIHLLAVCAWSQTTAFSYQGRLTDGGNPANGSFQMQFKLFDALTGGNQIGTTLVDLPITATQGIFSIRLDFGASALNGANRWLDIAVRHNSGETYTALSPREQISSAPYSVRTLSASMADDSQKLGGVNASEYVTTTNGGTNFIKNQSTQQPASNFNISGNGVIGGTLGLGTSSPGTKLDVTSGGGDAIRGISSAGGRGVWGESVSWQGVYGRSSTNAGVVGESSDFHGVFGVADNNVNAAGVYGSNNAGGTGVQGETTAGAGVLGVATTGTGVKGSSATNGIGVKGESDTNYGVFGTSRTAAGVVANSTGFHAFYGTSGSINAAGVFGTNSANGFGVIGDSPNGTGVQGTTVNGIGVIAKSTGSGPAFKIEGNAIQPLTTNANGLPKALLFVLANGTISRCYNGVTGESTGTCGFSSSPPSGGFYQVSFPFNVQGRFFSFVPYGGNGNKAGFISDIGAQYVVVSTSYVDQGRFENGVVSDFYLIVY